MIQNTSHSNGNAKWLQIREVFLTVLKSYPIKFSHLTTVDEQAGIRPNPQVHYFTLLESCFGAV